MSDNSQVIFMSFERDNRLRLDQFSYEKPFVVDLYLKGIHHELRKTIPKPILKQFNMTEVELLIYEVDVWYKQNPRKKITERKGGTNAVIATVKGEIKEGLFTISEIDMDKLGKNDNLFSPPSLPIQFNDTDTVYKLDLNKSQEANEIEGNHWEIYFEVTGKDPMSKERHSKSYPAQIIKGAMSTYLFDNSYDIKKDEELPFGYVRMLKRHLTILGFYRIEKDPKFNYSTYIAKGYREDTENWGLDDTWPEKVKGESADELSRAIQHFHKAALEKWRVDFADGRLMELATGDITFDKEDKDVKAEVEGGYVGQKTKEEIRRWLNEEKEKDIKRLDINGIVDIKPKYRNPFIYSFCNAYEVFYNSLYKDKPSLYEKKSGRIMNRWIADSVIKKYCFVCTTATNWFFCHLFGNNSALGKDHFFKNAAGSSVLDATMTDSGTPRYYNTYFKGVKFTKDGNKWKATALNIGETESKADARTRLGIGSSEVLIKIEPAFLASWIHESDPERYQNTIKMLKLHQNQKHELNGNTANRKNKVQEFTITNEIVKIDGNSIILRYRPKKIVELFAGLQKAKDEYKVGAVTVKLTKNKQKKVTKVQFIGAPTALGISELKLQRAAEGDWSPQSLSVTKNVTVEVIANEYGMGPWRRAKVTFHKDDDLSKKTDNNKKVILATYDVKDTFCSLVNPDNNKGRHQNKKYNEDYTCQCGLHLNNNQIMERKAELGYWNIVMESRTGYGHGNSALSFIYHNDKVYALHAEHNHFIKSLAEEIKSRHIVGSFETFYTVFKVAEKSDIELVNQTFFWNNGENIKSVEKAEYDYFPGK